MKSLFSALTFLFLAVTMAAALALTSCGGFLQKAKEIDTDSAACVAQCIQTEASPYLMDTDHLINSAELVANCAGPDSKLKEAGVCVTEALGPEAAEIGAAVALCVVASCPGVL